MAAQGARCYLEPILLEMETEAPGVKVMASVWQDSHLGQPNCRALRLILHYLGETL